MSDCVSLAVCESERCQSRAEQSRAGGREEEKERGKKTESLEKVHRGSHDGEGSEETKREGKKIQKERAVCADWLQCLQLIKVKTTQTKTLLQDRACKNNEAG